MGFSGHLVFARSERPLLEAPLFGGTDPGLGDGVHEWQPRPGAAGRRCNEELFDALLDELGFPKATQSSPQPQERDRLQATVTWKIRWTGTVVTVEQPFPPGVFEFGEDQDQDVIVIVQGI